MKIVTKQNEIIEIDDGKAKQFITLKNMLEDLETEDDVPIPIDATTETLNTIFNFLKKNEKGNKYEICLPEEMEDNLIFNCMITTNFLDNAELLDKLAIKIADIIKSYDNPEDLRKRFGIVYDFEGEEHEQIERETKALKDM